MSILGLITARGGSKGIPGKNIAPVAGKPLVAWTVDAAIASQRISRIVISTDDPTIARVAEETGAEVPFLRPAELAQDDSPHQSVVEHAVRWLMEHDGWTPDLVVLLQPTSPLRTGEDIDGAVEKLLASDAPSLASVKAAATHPYLLRTMDGQGRLVPVSADSAGYLRRQDYPPAWELNGAIYIIRTASLLAGEPLVSPETLGFVMPEERSLDIDTPEDLHAAARLLVSPDGDSA